MKTIAEIEEMITIAEWINNEPLQGWSRIAFRAGVEYAEYRKGGGMKSERAFILDFLAENYEAPKEKSKK